MERVQYDLASLELYFERLFALLDEPNPPSERPEGFQGIWTPHSYTHFVKSDMVANVYSAVDFWLEQFCGMAVRNQFLPPGSRRKRGKNALDSRHQFLSHTVGLDLTNTAGSFAHLDVVREVRNCFAHGGGHAPPKLRETLSGVPGLELHGGLLCIDESFVRRSLDEARNYLVAVATALESRL